jgi:integrase
MKGTVYRKLRPDGRTSRWYAVIDLPPGPEGRRRQRTTTHDTKKQAQESLAQTILELRSGEAYDSMVTVAEFLVEWLNGKESIRPSTRQAYGVHVVVHIVPAVGHLRLLGLRSHHIEAMYRSIALANASRERPVGAATMQRIHATLMSALNTAVRRGLIRRNPAATVELAKAIQTVGSVWTVDQAAAFLKVTRGDPLALLYRILLICGLRRGEAVGLRWTDVDLEASEIKIAQQMVLVAGDSHVGPPKSATGVRTISLDQQTVELLPKHHLEELLRYPATGAPMPGEQLVFTTNGGSGLNPAYVSRHFTQLITKAGLPPIRLHDLRHTSASLGLAGGESLLEVSRRLGHSSITITADRYAHVSQEAAQRSAQRLGDQLG